MEWTNLAGRPELAPVKAGLARFMPTTNTPDAGPRANASGKDAGADKAAAKKARQAAKAKRAAGSN